MGWSGAVWPLSLVPYPKACTLHHPVSPTTWGSALENGHLSPGVVWSRVSRSAWSRTVSLHAHHSATNVLVFGTAV
jgi:hypothetical protein